MVDLQSSYSLEYCVIKKIVCDRYQNSNGDFEGSEGETGRNVIFSGKTLV